MVIISKREELLFIKKKQSFIKGVNVSSNVMQVQESKSFELINSEQHKAVLSKFIDLYSELFAHDGYGDIRMEMKILRRGQKEVIIHCGKQHRFILDCDQALKSESPIKALLKKDLLG